MAEIIENMSYSSLLIPNDRVNTLVRKQIYAPNNQIYIKCGFSRLDGELSNIVLINRFRIGMLFNVEVIWILATMVSLVIIAIILRNKDKIEKYSTKEEQQIHVSLAYTFKAQNTN